jgi:hypothetical protein
MKGAQKWSSYGPVRSFYPLLKSSDQSVKRYTPTMLYNQQTEICKLKFPEFYFILAMVYSGLSWFLTTSAHIESCCEPDKGPLK